MKIIVFRSAIIYLMVALFTLSAHAKSNPSVIIIGAGVSGLSAGQELHKHHIQPVILEARNRIGGRIQTVAPWGVAIDLGAAWIHGVNHNPFMAMAEKLHIAVIPSVYNDNEELKLFVTFALYDQSGARVNDARIMKNVSYLEGFEAYLGSHSKNLYMRSLSGALHEYRKSHQLSVSEDYLIHYLLRISYTFEFAVDPARLSANADVPYASSVVSGENVFPVGGYAMYLPYLSEGLNIKLNQVVNKVVYGSDGVDVYTQDQHYHADYAIITVPLGVLKANKIKFIPALPAKKRKAISQLGMGVYDKIILHFDHVFWDVDKEWIGMLPATDSPENILEVMNLAKFTNQPDLLIFTADMYAKQIEGWSDKQTIDVAMQMLRRIYGDNIPEPTKYVITRWNNDPFTLGSYSYLPKNTPFSAYHHMAEPVRNKLFFAGEATSLTDMATVHGAYQTGIRAASELMGAIKL